MQSQTVECSHVSTSLEDSSSVVLLADAFSEHGLDSLSALGCTVEHNPALQGDELKAAIEKCCPSVLVVRSTKVTEEMIDASDRLTLIVRAGAGFDTIDVDAASARGISVANCPGKNAIAVAELTWGLILACDRRIPAQTQELHNGTWNKKKFAKAKGLFGRTIGVVGLGGIGSEVLARASSFGMHVVAWSRSLTAKKADELGIGWCENLQNIAKMSDVVSVHLASTTETEKLLSTEFFNAMKDGAIFVNTSRGHVVDEQALYEAAITKNLRVGLDVYANEPSTSDAAFDSKLASAPFVCGTHHIGASTEQAQEAIASEVVSIVSEFVTAGRVLHCVNLVADSNAQALLCVRHKNLPGVLAHIFDELSVASVNVEEMENVMYFGNKAACARIQLDSIPSPDVISVIKKNKNILSVTLTTQN